MRTARRPVSETSISEMPGWYRSYSLAMLERSRDVALYQIECAQKAIQDRVAELRLCAPLSSREIRDLQDALNHLTILLQQFSSETGRVLWD